MCTQLRQSINISLHRENYVSTPAVYNGMEKISSAIEDKRDRFCAEIQELEGFESQGLWEIDNIGQIHLLVHS